MNRIVCIFFILSLTTVLSSRRVKRVTNGEIASENKFLYHGYVSYNGNIFCSVSIIHKRWTLTTTSCIKMNKEGIITVGSKKLDSKNKRNYEVEIQITYPTYRFISKSNTTDSQSNHEEYAINDIGLIRVKREIEFDLSVQPIRLDRHNGMTYANLDAIIAGWGLHMAGEFLPPSNDLYYVEVKVTSERDCYKDWPLAFNCICTSRLNNKGTCIGDGGGAVVVNGVQIGVTSSVNELCNSNLVDLNTRISDYVPWITNEMQKYSDILCD